MLYWQTAIIECKKLEQHPSLSCHCHFSHNLFIEKEKLHLIVFFWFSSSLIYILFARNRDKNYRWSSLAVLRLCPDHLNIESRSESWPRMFNNKIKSDKIGTYPQMWDLNTNLKRVLLGGRFVIEFEMKYNFLEILISILNKLFNWKVFQSWSNQNIVNFEENHLNGQSIGSYFKCKLSFRKIQ